MEGVGFLPGERPLDHLPIFMALHGKTALVVGGTPAADQRAGLLAKAGASVRRIQSEAVVAADFVQVALAFAKTHPKTTEKERVVNPALPSKK